MRIIVDAYGGDNAPEAVLRGCRMAADQWKCEIILTGDGEKVACKGGGAGCFPGGDDDSGGPGCLPDGSGADRYYEAIQGQQHGARTPDAGGGRGRSLCFGRQHRRAGGGGALIVKRIKGVKRPAIGTVVPCKDGCFMMLDSGANHDCRPEMLRQFGLMGSRLYGSVCWGCRTPGWAW